MFHYEHIRDNWGGEGEMKSGDYVRFDFIEATKTEVAFLAYGSIVWIEGENANVDYKNPVSLEHEVKPIALSRLTKIGNG